MPHRRPVNEYERESGDLYRCKRVTNAEKLTKPFRMCKQIGCNVEFRHVHKHFAVSAPQQQRAVTFGDSWHFSLQCSPCAEISGALIRFQG
jgi:hypothetical protein